ncbi:MULTISPECIES: enoyl-CoA hydratase-related protein [Aeromonas]|jgi:methylglutaconyl-CoA hydratase|uniref:Crotonase n=1 Tax=Aeromonas media TaxID=651 RepID=A0AAE7AGS5_AERME|nr:enoyl-CoA hydratase-related protein [Aeromonas media]MBP8112805.1 enoyl-CoA hydratase/isomerase family protein [Aeromonas sp.]MBP8152519.1 enoyl-CoA hydratase/isomerase family protein [Aeromonas sp.]MBP8188910.1 enoyl-CoA hydratase/isomerase family protein [Aeromonas sp.]MBP9678863.1 enoyl-CoA hydratase/isomerase family protein [Aeromonas sp.]MBS4638713.1 enoyl-CoA hydratase/isomerase family protein [Aeromonas media]
MSDPLYNDPLAGCRLERHGPLVELVLARPARHNALDADLMQELLDCLDDLAHRHGQPLAERPHVLLLRAEGRHFCAGADLNWMRNQLQGDFDPTSFEKNREDARVLARLMQALDELPFPTVALVQGAAYGGALGLLCACDIVLASDDARFCLSEVSLGLVPAVISPYVVRAMGMRQARRYMLSAEPFDAITACRLNVAHRLCTPDQLLSEGRALGMRLCRNGPEAMKETKRLLAAIEHQPGHQHEEITVETIARVRVGLEAQEGMQAFFDKRPPSWRPRFKDET